MSKLKEQPLKQVTKPFSQKVFENHGMRVSTQAGVEYHFHDYVMIEKDQKLRFYVKQ